MNPDFRKWAEAVIDGVKGRSSIGNLNLYLDLATALKQAYDQGITKGKALGEEEFRQKMIKQVDVMIDLKSKQFKGC